MDTQGKITELEARKAELSSELEALQAAIDSKTESLAGDMLDRVDVSRGLAELAKLHDKKGVLESAIHQAAERLADLGKRLREEQRQAAIAEYAELNESAGEWVEGIITQLIELQGGLDAFMELWREANRVASPWDLREGDNLRFIYMARDLKVNIDSHLRKLEGSTPAGAILTRIRAEHPTERGMTPGEYFTQLWGEMPPTPKPDMSFLDPNNYLNRR